MGHDLWYFFSPIETENGKPGLLALRFRNMLTVQPTTPSVDSSYCHLLWSEASFSLVWAEVCAWMAYDDRMYRY